MTLEVLVHPRPQFRFPPALRARRTSPYHAWPTSQRRHEDPFGTLWSRAVRAHPCRIAHSRTSRRRPATCQTQLPPGLEMPPSACFACARAAERGVSIAQIGLAPVPGPAGSETRGADRSCARTKAASKSLPRRAWPGRSCPTFSIHPSVNGPVMGDIHPPDRPRGSPRTAGPTPCSASRGRSARRDGPSSANLP